MKLKKFVAAILLSILLLGISAGCLEEGSKTQTSQTSEGSQSEATKTLTLYVTMPLGNPYFQVVKEGVEVAVKELQEAGVKVEAKYFNAESDPSKQLSHIEAGISSKVDALIVVPVSDAVAPALKRAMEAGIPVILPDRDVGAQGLEGDKSEYRITAIATDNRKAAQEQAKFFIQYMEKLGKPKPWRVVILNGLPGVYSDSQRRLGIHDVIDPLVQKGEIEIVAEQYTDSTQLEKTYNLAQSVLAATGGEFDGVLAINCLLAIGMIKALKDAGYNPADYAIVGFDASDDELELIKKGEETASVAQSPFLMGYWSVWTAYYYKYKNWKPPSVINTPIAIVTKDNMEEVLKLVKSPRPLSEVIPDAPSGI